MKVENMTLRQVKKRCEKTKREQLGTCRGCPIWNFCAAICENKVYPTYWEDKILKEEVK